MRTWGRQYAEDGTYEWVEVSTDANGFNDAVYLTTIAQVLQMQPGESPFYADYGIPSIQAAQQNIPPDYYMAVTQAQFAPFFASLQIQKITFNDNRGVPQPAYRVTAVTHQGAQIGATIPI